jgi:hypothetical protein
MSLTNFSLFQELNFQTCETKEELKFTNRGEGGQRD